MRILGIDLGRRRIGFAISDPSQTLARPLSTLTRADGESDRATLDRVLAEISRLAAEDDGVHGIVVGVPARLDGGPTDESARVAAFIDALSARTPIPVTGQDERLSSREAESRLAVRERDWKKRKERLDAAAAAVILQDYLDGRKRVEKPEM
jgi:putative Holliday junction resolvase